MNDSFLCSRAYDVVSTYQVFTDIEQYRLELDSGSEKLTFEVRNQKQSHNELFQCQSLLRFCVQKQIDNPVGPNCFQLQIGSNGNIYCNNFSIFSHWCKVKISFRKESREISTHKGSCSIKNKLLRNSKISCENRHGFNSMSSFSWFN